MVIRPATPSDIEPMLAIYGPIVESSAVSFELEVPTPSAFRNRLQKYIEGWACLVCELEGSVAGYAYGSPHRERRAYRWSTETSVYVAEPVRQRGIGRSLYQALLPALAEKGYCNAYAGIALPNPASLALHESVGFRFIGTFPSVGRKFARWHDVAWFHYPLREAPPEE